MVIRTWLAVGVCVTAVLAIPEASQAPAPPTAEYPRLWAVEKGGKHGYIDRTGRIVIPLRFRGAADFSEGLGLVCVDEDWGYIDVDGRFIIPPKYDAARSFSEGCAAVKVGEKWGYVNRAGEFVCPPQFDDAFSFSDGLGRVMMGRDVDYHSFPPRPIRRKYGFVDLEGSTAIAVTLESAGDFHDGLGSAFVGGKRMYIDSAGKVVIDASDYTWTDGYSEGLACVRDSFRRTGRAGFINTKGDVAIQFQFEWAERFSEGLAPASLGKEWGYIDRSGEVVIPFQYAHALPFSEGLGAVRLLDTARPYGEEDWWTYVDREGKQVLPAVYNQVHPFEGDLAWVHVGGSMFKWEYHQPPVWINGSWRLIDRAGAVVWETPDNPPPHVLPDQ